MRLWRRYAPAAFAALAAVGLLSFLPAAAEHKRAATEVAAFRTETIQRLTNANLVDAFVALRLSGSIANVKWSQAVLSVELLIDGAEGRSGAWLQDARKLIRFSFEHTGNVNRLIVRFKEREQAGSRLLLAIDVRRSDSWLQGSPEELDNADPIKDPLWKKRLRLNFSPYYFAHLYNLT